LFSFVFVFFFFFFFFVLTRFVVTAGTVAPGNYDVIAVHEQKRYDTAAPYNRDQQQVSSDRACVCFFVFRLTSVSIRIWNKVATDQVEL
jgi:hypothetical protein